MKSLLMAAGLLTLALPVAAQISTPLPPSRPAVSQPHSPWTRTHRVVIQITQNDPALMNTALNNAENLAQYYKEKGEKIDIEFVAYGPGLSMFRSDTSPVKDRLAAMSSMKNVTFSACGNTLAKQTKQENKEISIVPEARLVPAGIARIVELEEQGWTYVRP
ncbi:MAG: DsrE family protein [Acetobacteraceae bacterium]|nr:DsrE family protein [Acetobacteraceae bacterium]